MLTRGQWKIAQVRRREREADATAVCKCGRRILFYNARHEALHAIPQCQWFKDLIASGPPPDASGVVLVDP